MSDQNVSDLAQRIEWKVGPNGCIQLFCVFQSATSSEPDYLKAIYSNQAGAERFIGGNPHYHFEVWSLNPPGAFA